VEEEGRCDVNQGRIRVLALWAADIACIGLVWSVCFGLWSHFVPGDYPMSTYLLLLGLEVLVFSGLNLIGRLYQGRFSYPGMPVPEVEEFRRLILNMLASHLLAWALLAMDRINVSGVEVSRNMSISRGFSIVSALLAAGLIPLLRDLMRRLLARLNIGQIPYFLIGDGAAGVTAGAELEKNPYYGIRIVRRFTEAEFGQLIPAARDAGVKHLIASFRDRRSFSATLREMSTWFTFIEYLPTVHAFPVTDARTFTVGCSGGLEMVNQRRMKLLNLEKSVVDRTLAFFIFVCALPAFAVVPVLIRLTSPGPALYRARRLGKFGEEIFVWKFRSMYVDADARLKPLLASDPKLKEEFEKTFKLKNDPRITPLGRILRKTSIDELPQLINVFCGEMALVGPRPIVKAEVSYYGEHYDEFSSVKPGITGLWQASGRSDSDYATRVAQDVYYIRNWSPWLDLWIVYRTVAAVLKMRGSY